MEDVYWQPAPCGYLRDGWRHWGSFGGVAPVHVKLSPLAGPPAARGDCNL